MNDDRRRIVATDVAERAAALGAVPLFAGLSEDDLTQLAARTHVLAFEDGDVIVPEGETGLGFYVVLSGIVCVTRDGEEIARLAAGDFFGETALLEWAPRNATVRASGAVRCAGILRSFFKELLAEHPRVAMRVVEEEGRRTGPEDPPGG